MTPAQRDELRRLAEAVQQVHPSPWETSRDFYGYVKQSSGPVVAVTQTLETRDFIAAANPAAVLDLLKEHDEDQGVIAVWRGRTERAEAERDTLRKNVSGHLNAIKEAHQIADAAKAENERLRERLRAFEEAASDLDAHFDLREEWKAGDLDVEDPSGINGVFAKFRALLGMAP